MRRGRPSLQSVTNEDSPRAPSRAAPNPLPPINVRLDKFDHWAVPRMKGRCRNPGCIGQTRISCSKCVVRLCLNDKNNCFKESHLIIVFLQSYS